MSIDYIFTAVSAICTIVSIIGARKAVSYYNKSKNLTIYANNNAAYIEYQKIITLFGDFLKFANPRPVRGVNIQKEIVKKGEDIKRSIDSIREKLSVQDFEDINVLLCTDKIDVEKYIDSIITCAILQENKFPIDDQYYIVRDALYDIQKILKNKVTQAEKILV